MRRFFWGAIALLVSCSSPADLGSSKDDGDDDDDDTTDVSGDSTPDGPSYFEPAFINVIGEFGWDSSSRTLIDVQTSSGAAPSHILLQYGSAEWEADDFSATSEHYCIVEVPFTSSVPAAWVSASPTYWMGFDYDPADGALTNCNLGDGLYDFDPAVWGTDPFSDIITYGWGMGISEINPELAAPYAGSPYESNVFGGVIPNTMFPYGEEDYVAVARQIDASFTVVLDGSSVVYLDNEAIYFGDNIATGWYLLVSNGLWTLGG